jgi:hypothetical protein
MIIAKMGERVKPGEEIAKHQRINSLLQGHEYHLANAFRLKVQE